MTREETIDALKYSLFGNQSGKQYSCGEQIEAIAEAIKLLQQTEDVSPAVHGEWISWYVEVKHGNCEEYIPHTACCACGTEIDPYHKDAYKWCPFCGAKMDGEHGKKN